MNTLTEQQLGMAKRLSKIPNLTELFCNETTEWKAVVEMQNSLDAFYCSQYIAELDRRGYTLGNAPIEQRVEAFIAARIKR